MSQKFWLKLNLIAANREQLIGKKPFSLHGKQTFKKLDPKAQMVGALG